jgi:hypothetical protein
MAAIFGTYPALSACTKGCYIMGWTLFSILYERTAISAGWFYFNGWTSLYSLAAYPSIYLLLAAKLQFVRKLENK